MARCRYSITSPTCGFEVPHPAKRRTSQRTGRPLTDRGVVSAVKTSEKLTAEVDAWAKANAMSRAQAICRLVELGLSVASTPAPAPAGPLELERIAIRQINELLDPSLPVDERERRIRRLVKGPPEFSAERIDLPKPRK